MASDDDSENLAEFIESEILSEFSDQEVEREKLEEEDDGSGYGARIVEDEDIRELEIRKEEEDNQEEEETEVNKMLIEEGVVNVGVLDTERQVKRKKVEEVDVSKSTMLSSGSAVLPVEVEAGSLHLNNAAVESNAGSSSNELARSKRIETGIFSKVPPELFHHVLKFLSPEDLVACSLVCRFLNAAASDESLWRRLYLMRWGLLPANRKPRDCAWKKLYIQRDEKDSVEIIRDCPSEFKMYYKQMQAAKRSQAPHRSQVLDDRIVSDKSVTDQVSIWKSRRGLTDKSVANHACSGETCSYYQIGDAFVCEKTGTVHVCEDACKEVVVDPADGLLVCTISGRCFDSLLSQSDTDPDMEQQQCGATDEAEPFMGSGRFARAYLLGYNCADEKELEDTLKYI